MEREKLKSEELITKTAYERSSLDRSLQRLEEDNVEMQRQIQQLQQQLAGKWLDMNIVYSTCEQGMGKAEEVL